jgi:hypothetical protein
MILGIWMVVVFAVLAAGSFLGIAWAGRTRRLQLRSAAYAALMGQVLPLFLCLGMIGHLEAPGTTDPGEPVRGAVTGLVVVSLAAIGSAVAHWAAAERRSRADHESVI